MVDKVSLERTRIRFRMEDSTTDVTRSVELVAFRERTWE